MGNAQTLHTESIVIDAVCPLVEDAPMGGNAPDYLQWYRQGGVTVVAPTVGGTQNASITLIRIAAWYRFLREREDLLLVRCAADFESAKRSGRLGVYLHLQGAEPIEDNLDLVDLYKNLGIGVIQLTYNVKNRVGDGCEERTDAGLSRFGIRLIERLNKAGVIVDCSHTGLRTTLEAVECSTQPVILSHSNAAAVHTSARNVPNELLDAIATSGGVVGVAGFPAMVADVSRPTLDHLIEHIDYIVQRIGSDHVGLGIDYYAGQAGAASDEVATRSYREAIRTGVWGPSYPPPPHYYPAGIETPRTLSNLTQRLLERGYPEAVVVKILGGNWWRVIQKVWG